MIKIGCAGFPVRQSLLFENLDFIEVGDGSPIRTKTETLLKWRETAGPDFEFALRAPTTWIDPVRGEGLRWKKKTPRSTAYQGRDHQIQSFRKNLNSRMIIFDIPSSLSPSPDRISKLQNLFRSLPASDYVAVWQPPKSWPESLVERFSQAMKIVPALDPLKEQARFKTPFHYFRIKGPAGTQFRDSEMKAVQRMCGNRLSYLLFDVGPTSFQEAMRFHRLAKATS